MAIVFDWHKRFWADRADISDDCRSRRSRISKSAQNIQTSKLPTTLFWSTEELEIAVCRAVAIFGLHFHKDMSTEWIDRHMK